MQVAQKVVVVTGAGSGIGRAIVLQLVRAGARVAAVDFNETTLRETGDLALAQGETISLHVVDVSDQAAVGALPDAVINAHGAVDGLINNAGIIQPFVRLNDLPIDTIDRVLRVNLYGQIYMTKAFLPHLMRRSVAHIVNISSMGGFLPVPGQTLYGASKAAVKLMSEGLYAELRETNVRVTVVFPGAVATNIMTNSGVVLGGQGNGAAHAPLPVTPEVAATTILNGIERDRFQVYVGKDARIMNILYRLNPLWATRFIIRQMKALLPD